MRVLTLVSIVLLMVASASAAPTWSYNAEGGFGASSGTIHVNSGDASNPASADGNDVHVEADPVNTSNTALDVDDFYRPANGRRAYLAYTDLPEEISMTGKIQVNWREYIANGANRRMDPWSFCKGTDTVADAPNKMYAELRKVGSVDDNPATGTWTLQLGICDAYTAIEPNPGNFGLTTWAMPPMAIGWHDFKIQYAYKGISATTGKHMAFVSAAVDGECLGTATSIAADFDINLLSIGCKWYGGDAVAIRQIDDVERGDLVDDYVIITPEPATALLLLSGCLFFRKRK